MGERYFEFDMREAVGLYLSVAVEGDFDVDKADRNTFGIVPTDSYRAEAER